MMGVHIKSMQMDSFQGRMNEPVTLHKYLYANGDPVNGIDPSGNMSLMSLNTSIAVVGILTTTSNIGITFLAGSFASEDVASENGSKLPHVAILSFGASGGSGGAMAEGGADVIIDFSKGKAWVYGSFGVGLSPITLFNKFKSAGLTKSVGAVWNFHNPKDWSGLSLSANWPVSILHLLPRAMFSDNRMWGAMTQLANRSHNAKATDITVSVGVSTSGPVALKLAWRSNSFSSAAGYTSDPIEIPIGEFYQTAKNILNDFGNALDEF